MRQLVVSFPKSGRTWLRYGLHLTGHEDIRFTHDGFEYNDGMKPPLDFDRAKRLRQYRGQTDRIVYIERDTRDTIVSLYHQITGRFRDFFGYESDISDFLRDPYFGVNNLIGFQVMWRELANSLPVLTVRYEEMNADYGTVLHKVSDHFGLEIGAEELRQVALQTNFDAMKHVEQSRSFAKPWLQPRMGAPKVRQGKVGGYAQELRPEDIAYVECAMRKSGLL